MITVSGKTFDHRITLKQLGGKYDGYDKTWRFSYLSDRDIERVRRLIGVTVTGVQPPAPTPERMKPTPRLRRIEWPEAKPIEKYPTDTKSNIFGDDKTWHNYFAEQNPISYYGFSSLNAFADFIDEIKPVVQERGRWDEGSARFYGTDTMQEALEIARNGWSQGVEIAERAAEYLTGEHAISRKRAYSVAGGTVNIGRLMAGNPMHMRHRPKQPNDKIVTLFVSGGMLADIDSDDACTRAGVVAAAVDIMENNGYSCEIVSVATNTCGFGSNRPMWHLVTQLKQAGEPLNINDLVFALGHSAYFRRMAFASVIFDTATERWWRGMGRSTSAFNADHPTGPNEFYINRLKRNPRAGHEIEDISRMILKDLPVTYEGKDDGSSD